MVEVFKTNVNNKWSANKLTEKLQQHFPDHKINFDLDDCDNILRVEGVYLLTENIKLILNENGFMCEALE
jgi:hypothetical protein